MRDVAAIVSDLHSNHPSGLFPADGITQENGNVILPNLVQRWTWDRWVEFWRLVSETRSREGGRLFVFVLGEHVDGFHHGSTEFLSANRETMRRIGLAVMRPALALNPNGLFCLKGTEVHSGKQGEDDEQIARELGAVQDPKTGQHAFYHLRVEINGTRFDMKHHTRSASLPHTAGGNANRLAAKLVYEHYNDPETQRPHLAFRGHVHKYADSYNLHPIRVIVNDPFQMDTVFGHKIDDGAALRPIGGHIVVCDGDNYRVERHAWAPTRTPMLTF